MNFLHIVSWLRRNSLFSKIEFNIAYACLLLSALGTRTVGEKGAAAQHAKQALYTLASPAHLRLWANMKH